MEPLGIQLFIELLDEPLEGRAFELQAELVNRLGEDLLNLGRCFLEIGHRCEA
jgi:hypothetical protein